MAITDVQEWNIYVKIIPIFNSTSLPSQEDVVIHMPPSD